MRYHQIKYLTGVPQMVDFFVFLKWGVDFGVKIGDANTIFTLLFRQSNAPKPDIPNLDAL